MNVSDALSKFSERYANNPYIKGIIETSITGELQLQALKDKGIEELKQTINILKSEIEGLKKDLDSKETEIASLNQNIESMVLSHTKQLEEIEVNVAKLVKEREELIEHNRKQSKMIEELEKLITQYEQFLKTKDREIEESKNKAFMLKERISRDEREHKCTLKNKDQEITQMKNRLEKLESEKVKLIDKKKKQLELFDVVKTSLLESNREIDILENDKKLLSRKIENYDSELMHYGKQIEQLKEENKLTLSTTNLLKMSNQQLESQLETLIKQIKG
jgi:exonuclease SbcC